MAATGDFRGLFEASISGSHMEVERHPYHKNCGCAFHGSRGGANKLCRHHKPTKISYPIRRCWSEGSFALYAAANAAGSASVSPSPSSSPAIDADWISSASISHHRHHPRHLLLEICNEEEADDLFPCKT